MDGSLTLRYTELRSDFMAQKNVLNQVKTANGYDVLYPLTPYQVHQAKSVTGDGSHYSITIDLPAEYITTPIIVSFKPNVTNIESCTISVNNLDAKTLYIGESLTIAGVLTPFDICLVQYDVNSDVANIVAAGGQMASVFERELYPTHSFIQDYRIIDHGVIYYLASANIKPKEYLAFSYTKPAIVYKFTLNAKSYARNFGLYGANDPNAADADWVKLGNTNNGTTCICEIPNNTLAFQYYRLKNETDLTSYGQTEINVYGKCNDLVNVANNLIFDGVRLDLVNPKTLVVQTPPGIVNGGTIEWTQATFINKTVRLQEQVKSDYLYDMYYDKNNDKMRVRSLHGDGTPSGIITMFSGAISDIPFGWFLCNGSNGTPDLRDRFVVGVGNSYNVGDTGGANTVTLTVDQMPAHTHTVRDNYNDGGIGASGGSGDTGSAYTTRTTSSVGGGQSHENRPPYYALAYIMKG